MRKISFTFTSTNPAFEGWEWELQDQAYDWYKPRILVRRPDGFEGDIFAESEAMSSVRSNVRYDAPELLVLRMCLDWMRINESPPSMPGDVRDSLYAHLADFSVRQRALERDLNEVMSKLRTSLKGVKLPQEVLSYMSTEHLKTALMSIKLLAEEGEAIQHEANRLAAVPKIHSAVKEALSDIDRVLDLQGLTAVHNNSASYKVYVEALEAASALNEVAASNPWIKEFKDAEAAVKERADATIKAVLDSNPALKALVNQDARTFNAAIQEMMDASPGLRDIINQGAPAFDAGMITNFNQCPHCGREI